MARRPYYEIDKAAYLFGYGLPTDANGDKPEETVRQWCAHELLRAYGISVCNIEFERAVRVGSKRYGIDILVSSRGAPSVVVECKPRDHTKHADGMAQAISYADSQTIRAEF